MKLISMLLEGGTSISEARTIVEVIQRDRLHFMAQCQALINIKSGMIGPVPTIDIAHFLSATLGLTAANSFVVMKVDIEGPEWVVMDHLRSAGGLGLVKETMIECHWDTHGGPFKGIPLAECHRQQQRLRDAGVAAHEWY